MKKSNLLPPRLSRSSPAAAPTARVILRLNQSSYDYRTRGQELRARASVGGDWETPFTEEGSQSQSRGLDYQCRGRQDRNGECRSYTCWCGSWCRGVVMTTHLPYLSCLWLLSRNDHPTCGWLAIGVFAFQTCFLCRWTLCYFDACLVIVYVLYCA